MHARQHTLLCYAGAPPVHAAYHSPFCHQGRYHFIFSELHRLTILQLLEAIGAITRSEADKASSRTVNYQDSVTSPLDPTPKTSRTKKTPGGAAQAVDDEGDSEEEEEEGNDEQVSEQDVSTAVGKVRYMSLSFNFR